MRFYSQQMQKKTQEGFFFRCTLVTPYEECWGVPLEQPMRLTRSIVWLSNGIFPTKGAPKLSVIWAHRICLAPHSRTPHTLTWTKAGIPKSRRSDTLDIWPRAPFFKKNPPSDFCCLVSFSHPRTLPDHSAFASSFSRRRQASYGWKCSSRRTCHALSVPMTTEPLANLFVVTCTPPCVCSPTLPPGNIYLSFSAFRHF